MDESTKKNNSLVIANDGSRDWVTLGETLLKHEDDKTTHTEEWKGLIKFFGIEVCEERLKKAMQARDLALGIKSVETVKEEVRKPEEFEF